MELVGTGDSTISSYWLNWRVLLCAIFVAISMVLGSYLIWKYEGAEQPESERGEYQQEISHTSCNDKIWMTCVKQIHPIWLLTFRIIAFCLLLTVLIVYIGVHGTGLFYFYTQWTFTMLTIYFGFGSVLSTYGCCQHQESCGCINGPRHGTDAEQGSYVPPPIGENATNSRTRKKFNCQEEYHSHESSSTVSYIFQVMFQTSAGAVMLTDCVYWFIIFPFLTLKDYNLHFLTILMHSLNAFLLLGDTALNCLWFPWFRISYFFLWTGCFVIFQWIIHACISIRWPYPFMDLSSPNAPIWYLMVGLMHIPCYGIFGLIVRLKHYLLHKYFPESDQCMR